MKKLLFLLLALSAFFFTACDEESDSLTYDEDYAGIWYFYDGSDIIKVDIADTAYTSSWKNGSSWEYWDKGTVTKLSATQVTLQMTDFYASSLNTDGIITGDDEGWYTAEELTEWGGWSSVSAMETETDLDFSATTYGYTVTTTTLILTGGDPDPMTMYSTEAAATP